MACRLALSAALLLGLSACGYINFNRRMSEQEMLLREDVAVYYASVQLAFATGNPDGLLALFSPSITHPMTYDEIQAWAKKFFAENKNAYFVVKKLEIESIGPAQAVVVLTYEVRTPTGKGDFGGAERDTLTRDHGHWYTAAWDKISN